MTEPFPERTFKYCLSLVKVKARASDTMIEVRPDNVDKFKEMLDKHECKHERIDSIIRYLNTNPAEWIKFER